jgi:hypothetical protein
MINKRVFMLKNILLADECVAISDIINQFQ